jgi:hypothetical protein
MNSNLISSATQSGHISTSAHTFQSINHHNKMASTDCPFHRNPQAKIPIPAHSCAECDHLTSLLDLCQDSVLIIEVPSKASPPSFISPKTPH